MPSKSLAPKRHFYISGHSVDRFRQRTSKNQNLDDETTADFLDRVVFKAAQDNNSCEEIMDNGIPATLVDISKEMGEPLWAIIKENKPRIADLDRCIASILSRGQVESSRRDGKWVRTNGGSQIEPPKIALATLKDKMPNNITMTKTKELRLVSYCQVGKAGRIYCEYEAANIQSIMDDLHHHDQKVERDTIRLYREVKFKTRLVIEEE